MIRHAVIAVSFAIVALPAAAAASGSAVQERAAEDAMLGMLTMKPGAEMSEADRGYVKSLRAMQDALMRIEMTGDAGGDWVRVMMVHHQSAIDMIDAMMAQKDVDPEIAGMAETMRAAQAKEIVELQKWLERHPK